MSNYNFTLSNGDTLVTLEPLEQNGVGNTSTSRTIVDVNIDPTTNIVSFTINDDLTSRFVPGFQFDIIGSSDYEGTYTVGSAGSVSSTIGSQAITIIPVNEQLPLTSFAVVAVNRPNGTFYVDAATECPFVPTTSIELTGNTFGAANDLYTIESAETTEPRSISDVDTVAKTWKVAGDYRRFYPVGKQVVVTGNTTSGGGTYTVASVSFAGASVLDMGNNRIASVATPVNPPDAANKQYV